MGVSEQQLADHLSRQKANDLAMSEALPGPVRDAFTPVQDIAVGPFKVRPCYDGHIEYLSLLKHPLHEMRVKAMTQGASVANTYEPQGPRAWELCFLFTHTLDEIDELVAKGGLLALQAAAKKEFSRQTLLALVQLSNAVIQQYAAYWQPVLGYKPAEPDADADGGEKKTPSS